MTEYCELLGGEYGYLVQGVLLSVAIISLLIRRYREHPKRRTDIWLLDISKQGLSSLMAHGIGMLVSFSLSIISEKKYQCGWYLITYFIDTCFGVYFAYKLLKYLEKKASQKTWTSLKDTGFYGFPKVDYKIYFKQLLAWILIVAIARLFCFLIILILFFVLIYPVKGLTSIFDGHPNSFLVCVMLVGPIFLNSIQVYIQDRFLGNQYKNNELCHILRDSN